MFHSQCPSSLFVPSQNSPGDECGGDGPPEPQPDSDSEGGLALQHCRALDDRLRSQLMDQILNDPTPEIRQKAAEVSPKKNNGGSGELI